MDGMILKRMVRRPWLLLVSLLVSGALCMLLCLLIGYRDRQAEHLENVRNSYEIKAVVTDLRGTKSDRLFLSRRYTDFLRDEENGLGAYIKDLCLTKSFLASSPIGSGKAIGVTGERCADALNTRLGGAWFSEVEDFFESEERICLVPASVYDDYAGETLTFNLTDEYAMEGGSDDIPLRVIGWYKGEGTTVFLPFPTSQAIAAHLAEAPSVDTASFIVKDNARVDELLEIAYKKFHRVDPSSMETDFALTVYDKQYKATITSMEQNIRRTSMLLPLIGILGLGAGFLLGLLGTRGEVRTYALMRTLGMNGFELFCSVMIEQLLPPLFAAAVVGLIFKRPLPTLVFFGCHLVGCALAVLRPVSVSPTRLLRDQE